MATLTVASAPGRSTGIVIPDTAVAVDPALTDKFANDGATLVYVNNGSGGSLTITENWGANASVDGVTPTARTISLASSKDILLGPYPTATYNDVNGFCSLTWSTSTSVKVLAFKAK